VTARTEGGRRTPVREVRTASRRFEEDKDQRAVYADLSPASIGTTQRPEVVWDLLAGKLTDAGILPHPLAAGRSAPRTW